MSVAPHSEWFTIYTFQEDENGMGTVQALCEYMQEAAGNHAAALGVSVERLREEGVAWVLARMRIAPVALPPVYARIQVETWPVSIEGLRFRRDFVVRDESGAVLARAVSYWVVVSLATRKIGRIPAFIAAIAPDNAPTVMDDARLRVPEVGGSLGACVFRARLADVDRNRHVNNVRYMEWIVESVPAAVRAGAALADLDLAFRMESYWKDVIAVHTEARVPDPDNGGDAAVFFHSLVRDGDGGELVRARSVWRFR